MTRRVSPTRSPRKYPRDPDQRVPAFQILMNGVDLHLPIAPAKVNRRSLIANTSYHYSSSSKNKLVMDSDTSNNNKKGNHKHNMMMITGSESSEPILHDHRQTHHVTKLFPEVHQLASSKESVTSGMSSGYRGPACSFAKQFQHNDSPSSRKKSISPSSRYGSSMEEDWEVTEPADVIVWNANRKRSRPNILCPLTDSDFRNINSKAESGGQGKSTGRERSKSLSNEKPHQNDYDDIYNVEDHYASLERAACSSASTASTYSAQIATVTQQLEEIQQAQNDVLKQLGEEITKVTTENESLKSEVEHVRTQKDGLIEVIKETTDELERMKHIFRIRGLHLPPLLQNEKRGQAESGLRPSPSPNTSPSESEQNNYRPNTERRSRSREGKSGRGSPGSRKHNDTNIAAGEGLVDIKDLLTKKKRAIRNRIDEDNQNLPLGTRIPLPHMQNKQHQRRTSNTPEKGTRSRSQSRERRAQADFRNGNVSTSNRKNNCRGGASPKRFETSDNKMDNKETSGGGFCYRVFGCCMKGPLHYPNELEDDVTVQEQDTNNSTPDSLEAD